MREIPERYSRIRHWEDGIRRANDQESAARTGELGREAIRPGPKASRSRKSSLFVQSFPFLLEVSRRREAKNQARVDSDK